MSRITLAAALTLVLPACNADFGLEGESDCDRSPLTENRAHTYDGQGRLTRLTVDVDGAPALIFEYAYDGAGRRIESRRFEADDPEVPVSIERETLDAEGRLLRIERFSQGSLLTTTITRDAQGRAVASDMSQEDAPEATRVMPDGEPHGPSIQADPFPLAHAGEPLVQPAPGEVAALWYPLSLRDEVTALDQSEMTQRFWALLGSPTHVEVTWGDAPPTGFRRDSDGDGETDAFVFELASRDEDTLTRSWDFDGDGVTDGHSVDTLDADGVVVAHVEFDDTVSPPREALSQVVDAEARTTTTVEGTKTSVVTFDAAGNRVQHTVDENGDGTMDWEKVYLYDAAGRRTEERRDRDADGEYDQIWTYSYDARGQLVEEIKVEAALDALCEQPAE